MSEVRKLIRESQVLFWQQYHGIESFQRKAFIANDIAALTLAVSFIAGIVILLTTDDQASWVFSAFAIICCLVVVGYGLVLLFLQGNFLSRDRRIEAKRQEINNRIDEIVKGYPNAMPPEVHAITLSFQPKKHKWWRHANAQYRTWPEMTYLYYW